MQSFKLKLEEAYKELMEELRTELKEFEQQQIRRIDQKIQEVRVLIKAVEQGQLAELARMSPTEYEKAMKSLCTGIKK